MYSRRTTTLLVDTRWIQEPHSSYDYCIGISVVGWLRVAALNSTSSARRSNACRSFFAYVVPLTLAAGPVKRPHHFLRTQIFAYCCYCIWCSWLFMAVDFQQTIPKSCITTAINLLILYGVLLWHLNKIILNKLILWFLRIFCRSVSLMCITHHNHSVREWLKER